MAEANEQLTSVVEYPLSFTITGFGIVILLIVEQGISMRTISSRQKEINEQGSQLSGRTDTEKEAIRKHDSTSQHDHCHTSLQVQELLEANSLKDLISAYALEVSTAIHSIVIGFELGTLSSYTTIAILLAVLCFHQFVEGLGVGSVIKTSQKQLGTSKVITFILVFSLTVPLGVLLGLLIKPISGDEETTSQLLIEGIVTSVAAGSMVYISLVEMISEYFNNPEIQGNISLRLYMLVLFFLGYASMNIIGIWA